MRNTGSASPERIIHRAFAKALLIGIDLLVAVSLTRSVFDGMAALEIAKSFKPEQEGGRRLTKETGFDFHLVKPMGPADLSELLAATMPATP